MTTILHALDVLKSYKIYSVFISSLQIHMFSLLERHINELSLFMVWHKIIHLKTVTDHSLALTFPSDLSAKLFNGISS